MTDREDFYRLVAEARNPDRLFAIRSSPRNGYFAGSQADGTQVLVGKWRENLLVLSFSKWGGLYDIRREKLPAETDLHGFLSRELKITPGLVRVRQFLVSDDDCGFWVGPLPWSFNEFLAAETEYTPDERVEYPRMIREFISRGDCVLDWANEWRVLDSDGHVVG